MYWHSCLHQMKDGTFLIGFNCKDYPQSEEERKKILSKAICGNSIALAQKLGVNKIKECKNGNLESAMYNLKRIDEKLKENDHAVV